MKDLLIAKKQELEAKKAEILNTNVDEAIAEQVANFEAELKKCYEEKQRLELNNIEIKMSVVDEMIAECDNVKCVDVTDAPMESAPIDSVDTYEVVDEA